MNDTLQEDIFALVGIAAILAGLIWLFFRSLRWATTRLGLSIPKWLLVTFSAVIVLSVAVVAMFLGVHEEKYAGKPPGAPPPPLSTWPRALRSLGRRLHRLRDWSSQGNSFCRARRWAS